MKRFTPVGEPFPLYSASHTGLADYLVTNEGHWEYRGVRVASVTRDAETGRWLVTLEAIQ